MIVAATSLNMSVALFGDSSAVASITYQVFKAVRERCVVS